MSVSSAEIRRFEHGFQTFLTCNALPREGCPATTTRANAGFRRDRGVVAQVSFQSKV
jgi:hypothetical protein